MQWSQMNAGLILTVWFMLQILIIEAWDLWALYGAGDYHLTVSYWLSHWAGRFPIVAFAIGVVVGHLFWRISRNGD